jgi:hypothetical protein
VCVPRVTRRKRRPLSISYHSAPNLTSTSENGHEFNGHELGHGLPSEPLDAFDGPSNAGPGLASTTANTALASSTAGPGLASSTGSTGLGLDAGSTGLGSSAASSGLELLPDWSECSADIHAVGDNYGQMVPLRPESNAISGQWPPTAGSMPCRERTRMRWAGALMAGALMDRMVEYTNRQWACMDALRGMLLQTPSGRSVRQIRTPHGFGHGHEFAGPIFSSSQAGTGDIPFPGADEALLPFPALETGSMMADQHWDASRPSTSGAPNCACHYHNADRGA